MMHSKHTLFGCVPVVVLMMAMLLSSCSVESVPAGDGNVSGERMGVRFLVEEPVTKAPVTAHEADVNWYDVLVYRSDVGTLDAVKHQSGRSAVTVDVSGNTALHWYVIANGPSDQLSGYRTESAFLEALSLLTQSTETSLVMQDDGVFVVSDDQSEVTVRLDRFACKVTVNGIEVKYIDSLEGSHTFTLERIALINVVGAIPYSGVPIAPSNRAQWYNRMTIDNSAPALVKGMTVTSFGSQSITSSARVSCVESLYCMPNPTSNSVNSATDPNWSVRNTRVVVELKIDGESNWYSVDLPAMQPNTHYILDKFTIMGPGAEGPDYPVQRNNVSFTVEVRPWTLGEPVDVVFPE